jgi:hypothetical protein
MTNKIKAIVLLNVLAVSISAFAKDKEFSLVNNNVRPLQEEMSFANSNEINYSYEWTQTHQLNKKIETFLGINNDFKEKVVLLCTFNFEIYKKQKTFNGKFFEDLSVLEELSGMDYKTKGNSREHIVTFKPHPFKTITAQSKMIFPNDYKAYEDTLNAKFNPGDILVHQTVIDFTDYLDRTDIITHIQATKNGSRFTIYSIAVLNETESNSSLLPLVKAGMIQQLKTQMQSTPNVFSK